MDQHMGIVHTVHPYHCVVHYWEAVNTYMQQHLLEISLCLLVTSVPGGSEDLLEHLESSLCSLLVCTAVAVAVMRSSEALCGSILEISFCCLPNTTVAVSVLGGGEDLYGPVSKISLCWLPNTTVALSGLRSSEDLHGPV